MNLPWIREKIYSQEELKNFLVYNMNTEEIQKIKKLNLDDMINKLVNQKSQIKYIKGVGYIWISEGYLILEDGTEPVHYFCEIYKSSSKIKKKIIEVYEDRLKRDCL